MKKILALTMFLILVMVVPAFAQVTVTGPDTGNLSPVGANLQQGQGQSLNSTISPNINVNPNIQVKPEINNDVNIGNNVGIGNKSFSPSATATIERGAVDIDNKNININKQQQGQIQGQQQGQGQGQNQNNDQVIAPSQEINITAPSRVAVGSAPNVVGPGELNFVSPNERDVQTLLPKFGCGVILPLQNSDCIVDVLWQSNDIKFKDLYKEVLKGLRSNEVQKLNVKTVRYQIREAASAKSWTTGGSLSGNGVGQIGTTQL